MTMRGLFSSLSTCYIECTSFTGLHGLCRLTHELQIDTVTFHIRKNQLYLLKSTISFVLFWLNMAKRDSQRDVNILSQENALLWRKRYYSIWYIIRGGKQRKHGFYKLLRLTPDFQIVERSFHIMKELVVWIDCFFVV